ncbi:MAG: bifunctional riboflavin kinase/FAD synthetase [Solirubrobacteraceae bacterium]|nr:bifunctional riboflavin kinase/FAD synthetase [Solirubrobacteraceae bacterium]
MKLTWLPDAECRPRRIAIGTFDGVHLGHREVIAGADTVLTFDPHPSQVVHPASAPKLLTSLERKAELIASLGVEELVVIPFDGAFASQTPQEFLDHVLVERLGAEQVSVGDNFHFGAKAKGTPAMLADDGRFGARICALLEVEGKPVSSTRIRQLVAEEGDVAQAAKLLGSEFKLNGTVVHGDKRGRELGFPTANLVPDDRFVTPAHGIYACRTGQGRAAAVSIGLRPTFQTGRGVLIEAFVLDYEGDLYGQEISLTFVERLRGEERFDGIESLVEQMNKDVERTRLAVPAGASSEA